MNKISLFKFILFTSVFSLYISNYTNACTSVCLAKNGHVVFGNNLDWYIGDGYIFINKRNVKKLGLWFDNPPEWVSKYASITVNQDGREFPARGLNEVGLVIGEMTLSETEFPNPDSRYVVNTLQWMQYQLDNCATIADVIATDKVIRIDKSEYHSHFFICDSTGNCATIEWLKGKLVSHAYNDVPIKVLANSTYDYCIEHGNDPSGRFGKAAAMLDKYTSEDPVEYMFSILQNVSQNSTKWSLVFDAKNLRLYYKTAVNGETRYVSLHDFDLLCNSDVYMLNVNGIGSGNMFSKSVPYTQELNSQLTRSTYRQLEHQFGPFSEETLNKIFSYPATTRCVDHTPDSSYINLPILHLRGTSYEIGFQHGSIMKKKIVELIKLWKNDIEINYNMPANDFIKHFLDSTDYLSAIKKWTPDLLEEIKGISAGSEIDFNTIFAFQLTDEIWTNAELINPPHHCTSLGINNYKKDGSSNYIAQNTDITPFYHGFEIILDIQNENSETRKLVTTFAGSIGINGLNKYVGIIGNTLLDLKSSIDGLPVCCIMRGVLEMKSFEEAERFLKEIKHASGQNYIIGSKTNVSSFECSADLITVFWPDTTKNYTYHTNRALTNTSYHPRYLDYLKKQFNSTPESVSFGDPRSKLMESRILNNKSIDMETIKNVLAERPIFNDNTCVSTIMEFNNSYSELRIIPGKPDSTDYILFRIEN